MNEAYQTTSARLPGTDSSRISAETDCDAVLLFAYHERRGCL